MPVILRGPHGPSPAAPATPVKKKKGCLGCGCGGCLLSIVLILVLVAAAIYFFAILPASAGSDTPATLSVFVANTQVGKSQNGDYSGGTTGQSLAPGTWVKTDPAGRAGINFPDGSVTRLAPSTTIGITQAALDSHGALHRATLQHKGHGIDAEVRGTEFEIFVRPDGTILIKLFIGKLELKANNAVTLTAGQQTIVINGSASRPAPIVPEPGDPFLLTNGPTGSETVAAGGNQKGTEQTSVSATAIAAAGGTATTATYYSSGGDMTVVMTYPGSLMKLDVMGPNGQVVGTAQGPSPVTVRLPGAPPGAYVGKITGVVIDHGPDPWAVTFATNPPCRSTKSTDNLPSSLAVRVVLSDREINSQLIQGNLQDASVSISPTAGGAVITGHVNQSGASFGGTVAVYAAPPALGVTLVSASVNGINVTAQLAAQIAKAGGRSVNSVGLGFAVDRVYGCKGPEGGLMVIEGHG